MIMGEDVNESDDSESALDPYETDCYSSACEDGFGSDESDADPGDVESSPERSESVDFRAPCNAGTSAMPEVTGDVEEYSYGFKEKEKGGDSGGSKDYSKYVIDEEKRSCKRGVRKAKLAAESFLKSLKTGDEDDREDSNYRSGSNADSEEPSAKRVIEDKSHLRNLPSFFYKGVKMKPCSVQVTPIPDKILQQYGLKRVDEGHLGEQTVDLETLRKGLWPCDQCSFRTNYKRELTRHKWTHALDKVLYKCSICGMKFERSVSLSCHVRRTHRKAREKKVKNELVHKCPHCDYSVNERRNLKNHMMMHTGEKPFACPHCPYRARQHPHLKQHLYFHLDVKPYACTICDYRTRQKSHLNNHLVWVHSNEKPFKCSECDFAAKARKTLYHHVLSQHTDIKPWVCEFCPFKTAHNNVYNAHVKSHKEKLGSSCPECSWSLKDSRYLNSHVLQCHPDSKRIVSCQVCSYRTLDKKRLESHVKTKHNTTKVHKSRLIVQLPLKK